jgi:phosphoglycerate dehydrogenase-like enzyme
MGRIMRRAVVSALLVGTGWTAGLAVAAPAMAQSAAKPIPEGDIDALIKQTGLVESKQTVRQMVPGWRKPKAMLVAADRPDRITWLQKAVPDVKLIAAPHGRDIAWSKVPGIDQVDAAIGVNPSPALIAAAPNLKWFQTLAAGMEKIVSEPDVAAGKFLVTNSPSRLIPKVGDDAIAMMVALMRGLDRYVRMDVAQHMAQPDFGSRGWEMANRTVLVAGLGGIGTQVARMAHGLGMKVIATRETSHEGPGYVDYVGLSDELPAMVGKADVVIVALPLTSKTRNLFDASMFARMKRGAIFINVARGQEVVQPDLIAALETGQVGAAGLGPTVPEPLPDNDPLWRAPNILITTHMGAPTQPAEGVENFREKEWQAVRENMRRYTAGQTLYSVVDVKRGY